MSNSLDEWLIRDVILEGAKIDAFGVGERLITAKSEPVFGGVYKLAAIEDNGVMVPKMKISENVEKITNPGFKRVYRFFDNDTGKVMADLIALHEESAPFKDVVEIFDPNAIWKRKRLTNFTAKDLLVKVFDKGECVYESPDLETIRDYCRSQIETLWSEMLRFENPQTYYVDLSKKLWNMKHELLGKFSEFPEEL